MVTGRPATQRDVALRAGVSTATVSYIMSGRRDRRTPVSGDTRQRVLDAARALGYQRNHAARSLRRRKSELVCVVYQPPLNPWIEQLIEQVQVAAAGRGYSMILLPAAAGVPANRVLREQFVDGAIVVGERDRLPELPELAAHGLALVVLDDDMKPEGFDVVRRNRHVACRSGVEHLLASGHRRIAYLAHPQDETTSNRVRYAAYAEALKAQRIPIDESIVTIESDMDASPYQLTKALFDRDDRPTALFSASDRGAIEAMWALRDLGLSVPQDVAVVGVGNVRQGKAVRPSLTTVGDPGMDFSAAIDCLFRRIDQPDMKPQVIERPWKLIIRESAP
ncbi:MAG TPA: LacI family DNA-binding transcriptional regulator [Mycobacteriales bacterium]|nr:LacI family DNA-binding transcriptional regulator [Mycobacteriales bacterium]